MQYMQNLLNQNEIHYYKSLNLKLWAQYQRLTLVPLAVLGTYKFLTRKKDLHLPYKQYIKPKFIDNISCIFLFYGLVYYIADLTLTLMQDSLTTCNYPYILHHLVSIIFLPGMMWPHNYPWWQYGVPLFHAIIEEWQENLILDLCYFASIIIYHWGLYQEPWKHHPAFRLAKVAIIFIYSSVIYLFFTTCRDEIYPKTIHTTSQ